MISLDDRANELEWEPHAVVLKALREVWREGAIAQRNAIVKMFERDVDLGAVPVPLADNPMVKASEVLLVEPPA